MSARSKLKKMCCLLLVLGLLLPALALGQDEAAAVEAPQPAEPDLMFLKLQWVLSDMVRCIEQLRVARDNRSKRLLVEQIEELLYEEVEFPLFYMQADSADPLDASNIGNISDVVDGGVASPLAPLYGESFALMGIAKGFEGYQAAANDYIQRAEAIYPDVLSLKVQDDSSRVPHELGQWLSDSKGSWGATSSIRLTFYGKALSQDVIDAITLDTVRVSSEQPGRKDLDYKLLVAEHDLLRGLRRYVITDDMLTHRRSNRFYLYLPPGTYRLTSGVSMDYGTTIQVHTNPNNNHFMVETLESGIAVYPVPNMRELGQRRPAIANQPLWTVDDQQQPDGGGTNEAQ
ncbi:MAG: hypothetical protein P9M14_06315 [Candidatus Alcyoniella australis]|nr:hypothetical protein [Candidatus Alcyoniella australis]